MSIFCLYGAALTFNYASQNQNLNFVILGARPSLIRPQHQQEWELSPSTDEFAIFLIKCRSEPALREAGTEDGNICCTLSL